MTSSVLPAGRVAVPAVALEASAAELEAAEAEFLAEMARYPIAVATEEANAQHYEVPTRFYQLCLGPRFKYSSCYYHTFQESLAEAEDIMLALTCERAGLADGQTILELGCGWGSLSLFHGRAAYRFTVEDSVYVRPDLARRGIGSAMRVMGMLS